MRLAALFAIAANFIQKIKECVQKEGKQIQRSEKVRRMFFPVPKLCLQR
jgi:hypothetical protein